MFVSREPSLDTVHKGGVILTDAHKAELNKLIKMYKILNWIESLLFCFGFILIILLSFDVDIPFIKPSSPLFIRSSVTAWFILPLYIITKKKKKIDNRIKEIESMYDKRPFENSKR